MTAPERLSLRGIAALELIVPEDDRRLREIETRKLKGLITAAEKTVTAAIFDEPGVKEMLAFVPVLETEIAGEKYAQALDIITMMTKFARRAPAKRIEFPAEAEAALLEARRIIEGRAKRSELRPLAERLEAFGVAKNEVSEGMINTRSLEVKEASDPKAAWVMTGLRPEKVGAVIVSVEDLLAKPLKLAAPLTIRTYTEMLFQAIGLGSEGRNNAGVFLTFVEGVDHPVVVKLFKEPKNETEETAIERELYMAQFGDIIGLLPEFYGVIAEQGKIRGYAIQPVGGVYALGGRFVTMAPEIAKAAEQNKNAITQLLNRYGIVGAANHMVSGKGEVVLIDAGDITPEKAGFGPAQVKLRRDRQLLGRFNQALEEGRNAADAEGGEVIGQGGDVVRSELRGVRPRVDISWHCWARVAA